MKLISVELSGFKSISGALAQTIPLGDVTVLLGANGSGKSNLVQFFKLLNFLTTGALQTYVGKYGVRASIMVPATEILASGVSWPRKNTEVHGNICYFSDSVKFRVLPWQIAELGQSHPGRRRDQGHDRH